jgi:hypothetical protein
VDTKHHQFHEIAFPKFEARFVRNCLRAIVCFLVWGFVFKLFKSRFLWLKNPNSDKWPSAVRAHKGRPLCGEDFVFKTEHITKEHVLFSIMIVDILIAYRVDIKTIIHNINQLRFFFVHSIFVFCLFIIRFLIFSISNFDQHKRLVYVFIHLHN